MKRSESWSSTSDQFDRAAPTDLRISSWLGSSVMTDTDQREEDAVPKRMLAMKPKLHKSPLNKDADDRDGDSDHSRN